MEPEDLFPRFEQPRPLTEREREILDFLLSVDLPGIEELREQAQAKTARAERWGARDPSFIFYADKQATRPSTLRGRRGPPSIEASTKRRDIMHLYALRLWVHEDGWLDYVKFTPYADEADVWLEELLPPTDFDPPRLY